MNSKRNGGLRGSRKKWSASLAAKRGKKEGVARGGNSKQSAWFTKIKEVNRLGDTIKKGNIEDSLRGNNRVRADLKRGGRIWGKEAETA